MLDITSGVSDIETGVGEITSGVADIEIGVLDIGSGVPVIEAGVLVMTSGGALALTQREPVRQFLQVRIRQLG